MCTDGLLIEIENYRKNMIQQAAQSSLSNRKVIELSTKLDKLLNQYYKMKDQTK